MKHLLILICICAFASVGQSQNTRANANTNAVTYYDNDTLTNAGTVTQVVSDSLNYPYAYEIQIVSDSLSGATAGTTYIETKPYGVQGHMWCPVGSTVTINGGLTYAPITGTSLSGMVRVRTVGTGTESTRISTTITRYRITK